MVCSSKMSKLTSTINNLWILQRLIGQLNNHKINHLQNLPTVNVNKKWVLHNHHNIYTLGCSFSLVMMFCELIPKKRPIIMRLIILSLIPSGYHYSRSSIEDISSIASSSCSSFGSRDDSISLKLQEEWVSDIQMEPRQALICTLLFPYY